MLSFLPDAAKKRIFFSTNEKRDKLRGGGKGTRKTEKDCRTKIKLSGNGTERVKLNCLGQTERETEIKLSEI